MPEAGDVAPDFSLPDAQGRPHRLSDFRGKRVVLYFYPKDLTPGCTQQACGFRDHFATYTEEDIEIIGVSLDPPERHEEFATEHNLPFFLLSDVEAEVSKAYGVYGEKERDGKKSLGIFRTTFVINPDGTIERIMRDIQTESHALDVLRALGDPSS
jgi:peroxiredoxin Q/BCP